MMKNFLTNDSETRFNEVVFQNRHKNYGAYVLRNEEDLVLRKALFIGVALFVAISVVPLIVNSFKTDEGTVIADTFGPVNLHDVETPEQTPPIVIPPRTEQVAQINTTVPTPTANPVHEEPAANINDYDHAVAGTVNVAGSEPTVKYVPPTTVPTAPTTQPTVQPIDKSKIIDVVDVDANFNGGINAFRNKLQNNFDTTDFDGIGETMSTTVTFVVETDGTITNIKANGSDAKFNAEAERAIREIKGIWTPAKLKGESVRSRFRFPISMKFE